MIIKAVVKLQSCRTSARKAFVRKQDREHGIAKGKIEHWEVTGGSWAHIRRILRREDVMGHSCVCANVVESYVEDIGTASGAIRKLQEYLNRDTHPDPYGLAGRRAIR